MKRLPWSDGAPRHSLSSSPFFHAGLPVDGSFSLVAAGFPHDAALFLAAFVLCWVLEAGSEDVEPLLPEAPEP